MYDRKKMLAANERHNAKLDKIILQPYKDVGAIIRQCAAESGKSLNRFCLDIILTEIGYIDVYNDKVLDNKE